MGRSSFVVASLRALQGAAFALALLLAPTLSGAAGEDASLERRHGLSAFGDLKYPPDFKHFDYVNPDAPKGGRIRLVSSSGRRTFDHFNPFILDGDGAPQAGLLFDSLMARSGDEPDAMYGLVAHSVSMPPDRSYVIFYMRPEARFSDGSPVTAADVVWSFEQMKTKSAPWFRVSLGQVAKAEALDGLTVRFDFEERAVKRDLPNLVAGLPIFSKADFGDHPFEVARSQPPIGSGPYKIGDYAFGRDYTLQRRPDYWAADLPVSVGQNNFDVIHILYFSDRDVDFDAFKAGSYDFIEEFTSARWAREYDFPAIQRGWVKKEKIPDGRTSGTQGWWINTRREKFKDPRVRQAIGLAYDFETANRQYFYGIYARTDSFFENSVMQAEGPPTPGELALLEPLRDDIPPLLRAQVFGPAYRPAVNSGDGEARANLLRARALLEQAGWTVQDGVLKNAEGEVFEIEFLQQPSLAFRKIIRSFMLNLEVLGFRTRLRMIDPAAYEYRMKLFDFDLTVSRIGLPDTPGVGLRSNLHSSQAKAKGGRNLAGVRSKAIDALLEAIQRAEDRESLVTAARALDRVFLAGHYWVPNWFKGSHAIAYWDRFGKPMDLGIDKPRYERGVLSTWWYDAEKAAALDAKMSR